MKKLVALLAIALLVGGACKAEEEASLSALVEKTRGYWPDNDGLIENIQVCLQMIEDLHKNFCEAFTQCLGDCHNKEFGTLTSLVEHLDHLNNNQYTCALPTLEAICAKLKMLLDKVDDYSCEQVKQLEEVQCIFKFWKKGASLNDEPCKDVH